MAKRSGITTKRRSERDFFIHIASPVGRLEIASDGDSLTALVIERDGSLPRDGEPELTTAVLERARGQLADYFRGERRGFEVPVRPGGTPFQKSVWNEIARIGWGEATTYKRLSEKIGRPRAARAVGRAVGANPIPVVIGCHRVLSMTGELTGYSGGSGIPTKRWLLDHEKIPHSRDSEGWKSEPSGDRP